MKLPEVQFSNSGLLEKMLSINVCDRLVILVGSVICGTKRLEVMVSKKSLVSADVSDLLLLLLLLLHYTHRLDSENFKAQVENISTVS